MPAIQTAVGTLSYPHLFKAQERARGDGKPVYSTVLLFDAKQMKAPAYKAMIAAIEDLARTSFPKLVLGKSLMTPIHDAHEKENFPPEYEIYINAWSENKPGVVDNMKEDIFDSSQVWAGQHARLFVSPFAWEFGGKKGVSLGLQHVQIVRSEGLPRLDGRKAPKQAFDDEYSDADAI